MPTRTQCPHCLATFAVSEAALGRTAKCKKCTKPFTITEAHLSGPAPRAPNSSRGTVAEHTTASDGSMKPCPFCGQQIKAIAIKCRFCGTRIDIGHSAEVPAAENLPAQAAASVVTLPLVSAVSGGLAALMVAGLVILLVVPHEVAGASLAIVNILSWTSPFLAFLAVLLGAIALVRSRRHLSQYCDKRTAIVGVCVGGISLVAVTGMWSWALIRARAMVPRELCAANLRGIMQAMKIYANDFEDQYPPQLGILIRGGLITDRQFVTVQARPG